MEALESKLITPTLHVEVQISGSTALSSDQRTALRNETLTWLCGNYVTLQLGSLKPGHGLHKHVQAVDVIGFTGPRSVTGCYDLASVALDLQIYSLRGVPQRSGKRSLKQHGEEIPQAREIALPNVALKGEWDSLVFDDALPSQILRYLVRMMGMMSQAGLNAATFNWNRLCLLHGPPGSGKSTLCRALAQKLSIRLGGSYLNGTLVEVNANAMLSKYFGESGKLIESTFEKVRAVAQDERKLVVVVIDEVETIAGSRQRASNSGECNDGLRVSRSSARPIHLALE